MRIGKLLVANRGEIAARIFRTCARLGVETVAVCTPDDRRAFHTRRAGEVREVASYLSEQALVAAARESGADAVHPGYGFLAESPGFAAAVAAAGIVWVGPPAEAIRSAGDKLEAKRRAAAAGVPVLEAGTAEELGFPLLVKAAAGGGGRGMRVVRSRAELDGALESAAREARAAFGDETVFLERYLERPRHVEVQVVADTHGAVATLGERECSLQRRHQKILEESPAPGIEEGLRGRLAAAALAVARAAGYESLGTVEFLVEGDDFFFLELNARIQVEHPVTEELSGLDLVEHQLRIASGERLDVRWQPSGHAVEARLYAEHPRTFLPQPGSIERLVLPGRVRVDAGVEAGDDVSLAYDPLLAKLVAKAPTRDGALERLAEALDETAVQGVLTNLAFLRWLVRRPEVRDGVATTAFLAEHPPLSRHRPARHPWAGYWRLGVEAGASPPRAAPPEVEESASTAPADGRSEHAVKAPTPGTVVRVLARAGERVEARQPLVVLEAMKMETPLLAPYDAIVERVLVDEGERVPGGAILVELCEDGRRS